MFYFHILTYSDIIVCVCIYNVCIHVYLLYSSPYPKQCLKQEVLFHEVF